MQSLVLKRPASTFCWGIVEQDLDLVELPGRPNNKLPLIDKVDQHGVTDIVRLIAKCQFISRL